MQAVCVGAIWDQLKDPNNLLKKIPYNNCNLDSSLKILVAQYGMAK